MIKIYFCGSIRGGRELASTYQRMIRMLQAYGKVLTEHIGNDKEIRMEGEELTDKYIHDRDMVWIRESDVVIAEVTVPSLGVGYEIARAVELKKPVLCLFDQNSKGKLSAMISGCTELSICNYRDFSEAEEQMKRFISMHDPRHTS